MASKLICPTCGKPVKMGSANKTKVRGVWYHKHFGPAEARRKKAEAKQKGQS